MNPSEEGIVILLNEDEIRKAETSVARRLEAQGLPAEWARVGTAFRDQRIFLLRDAVRFPGNTLSTYSRLISEEDDPHGIIILPVYQQQILLIRHFRHAIRTWHLEIPL